MINLLIGGAIAVLWDCYPGIASAQERNHSSEELPTAARKAFASDVAALSFNQKMLIKKPMKRIAAPLR